MNLSDYYKYSVFSNLSYVEWSKENIGTQSDATPRIDAARDFLRAPGALAEQIFRRDQWYIPTTNGFVPNDPSGFAANLFVKGNSNQKILAIRGTEPDFSFIPLDLLPVDLWPADLYEIARYGLALHQAVSLINYVLLLKTPVGSQADQFTLHIEDFRGAQPPDNRKFFSAGKNFWLEATSRVDGRGILSASDTITVTGHSLGGHLAALALRLFPGLFDQGVTFNAAGFDNSFLSLELTDEFVGLFKQMLPQENPASSFASLQLQSRLFTAEAESARVGDDADVVPSWWTGADPTFDTTLIRTEVNSHSMDQLQDNLAIHSLIERLGVSISVETVFRLYDAASANGNRSSEVLVSADSDPAGPLRSILRPASRIAGDLNQHLFDTIYHATALETPDAVLVTADIRYLKAACALGGFRSLAE